MHLSRPDLMSLLYDGFQEHKERIITSANICDIDMDEIGVRVKLQDGSVEKGSVIIGCDGVHSQTRSISKYSLL